MAFRRLAAMCGSKRPFRAELTAPRSHGDLRTGCWEIPKVSHREYECEHCRRLGLRCPAAALRSWAVCGPSEGGRRRQMTTVDNFTEADRGHRHRARPPGRSRPRRASHRGRPPPRTPDEPPRPRFPRLLARPHAAPARQTRRGVPHGHGRACPGSGRQLTTSCRPPSGVLRAGGSLPPRTGRGGVRVPAPGSAAPSGQRIASSAST